MSAAIPHRPEGFAADQPVSRQRRLARNLPNPLRRTSPSAVATLAFLSLLLRDLVGSPAMGLRTPATTEPRLVVLWLAGALVIATTGLGAGLLAGTRMGE